jgi:hypothetical protein
MAEPNAALAYTVLDHIDAHPETWNQLRWRCGTTACFAGWVVALGGGEIREAQTGSDAVVISGPANIVGLHPASAALLLLGIEDDYFWDDEDDDRGGLFWGGNGRAELGRGVAAIFGPRPEAEACDA